MIHASNDEGHELNLYCIMCAKISNTTSVDKNLKFNQVRGCVTLLPSPFFSHYALLAEEIT